MSYLLRTSLRTSRITALAQPAARTFSASSMRALKEGHENSNEDGAAEKNEMHKQDQLQKQKEGKGHWKPELASQSEEAVAADRSSGNESIEEMQKKTANHAEEKHKHGTSQSSGL